jgi:hypothetical protein
MYNIRCMMCWQEFCYIFTALYSTAAKHTIYSCFLSRIYRKGRKMNEDHRLIEIIVGH